MSRTERGFTLLETLVALAILGVIMATVYAVIGNGLRTAHRDEDRLLLGLIAQNLLTRSQLDLNPAQGAIAGDIQGGLRWRIESEPYPVPANLLPEAPRPSEQSTFGSPGPGDAEDAGMGRRGEASSFGQDSNSSFGEDAKASAPGAQDSTESGLSQSESTQTQQEPRPPLRLRLIRVLVEKGDQQFALSTLAVEPPRGQNATR